MNEPLPRYIVLEKSVGETPLSCAEAYRVKHPKLTGVPLAYAGRLDPMASGKLLVLVGEECKRQSEYHGLDKEYEFSVLFGIESDTQDVLGLLYSCWSEDVLVPPSVALRAAKPSLTTSRGTSTSSTNLQDILASEDGGDQPSDCVRLGLAARSAQSEGSVATKPSEGDIKKIANNLVGPIELPYPHFSSKTVQGKPLHMWTLEGRLDEIEVPTKTSVIYELELTKIETMARDHVCDTARAKIDTIPPVTDERKALGNDFRRTDVRQDWERIKQDPSLPDEYFTAHFRCIASSGTYMRSLADLIAKQLDTCGLAWHIHRTKIGHYDPEKQNWKSEF